MLGDAARSTSSFTFPAHSIRVHLPLRLHPNTRQYRSNSCGGAESRRGTLGACLGPINRESFTELWGTYDGERARTKRRTASFENIFNEPPTRDIAISYRGSNFNLILHFPAAAEPFPPRPQKNNSNCHHWSGNQLPHAPRPS